MWSEWVNGLKLTLSLTIAVESLISCSQKALIKAYLVLLPRINSIPEALKIDLVPKRRRIWSIE